jgi:hypothetical protein
MYTPWRDSVYAATPLDHDCEIITDNHVATIYEAYQTDIDLSLEGFWKEVASCRTRWPLQNGMICQQHFVSEYASIQGKIACHSS